MKGTERFKQRIQTYLEELSGADSRFSVKFRNPRKNIDDCITYILNCVKQSECAGFEDDEIFGMAIHYYSEENIDVGKPLTCDVRIDHVVELTEEEKAQARQAAMERAERSLCQTYAAQEKEAGHTVGTYRERRTNKPFLI